MSLFKEAPLIRRSPMQKMLGQHPEENAVIELNNLFASRPVTAIGVDDVRRIEQQYSLDLRQEFRLNLEEFYAVSLNYHLQTGGLSDTAKADLNHLSKLLSLGEDAVQRLHTQIGGGAYQLAWTRAVAKRRISPEDRTHIDKLQADLSLPQELADKISADVRAGAVRQYVTSVIADERYSPAEEQELKSLASGLGVNLQFGKETNATLRQLRQYWVLENEPLRPVHTDLTLQKNEQCFIVIPHARWYELRSVRHRAGYSGVSTSFKVAKGIYLRSGSHSPAGYSTNEMTPIDAGSLYLTDKRIIFTGAKKNSNIRLEKILSIQPLPDGVEIGKDAGKSPVIQFTDRPDVFCILLGRLLREKASGV